jgi:hypothetical protein
LRKVLFEVPVAMIVKGAVFWLETPCRLEEAERFGEILCSKCKPSKKKAEQTKSADEPAPLFTPKCGGDMFLRNVELLPNYRVLQLRRQFSAEV